MKQLKIKYGLDVFDSFQNRIMIPIHDLKGQVVGFTGRIYHNEDAAKSKPKDSIISRSYFLLHNNLYKVSFCSKERPI